MALWRDPLDDLIDGLERALPTDTAAAAGQSSAADDFPLVELHILVQIVIQGSEEERARLDTDPRFDRFRAWSAGRAAQFNTPEARARLDEAIVRPPTKRSLGSPGFNSRRVDK